MAKRPLCWLGCGSVLVVVAFIAGGLWYDSQGGPFIVVSAKPKLSVTYLRTEGTNHRYYYGGFLNRIIDPIERRLVPGANRLGFITTNKTGVLWVRLAHSDFGNIPPMRFVTAGTKAFPIPAGPTVEFRAEWVDSSGAKTELARIPTCAQNFRGRFWLGGWFLPDNIESHRGTCIHIESTNGTELATFRVR